MPSILNSSDRASLISRLSSLQPETPANWGSLSAHGMLCHLADQLRVALGETSTTDRSSFLSRNLAKRVVLYLPLPVPKGKIQTAPEMLSTQPGVWQDDLDAVAGLVERLAASKSSPPHPAFGPLDHGQWCILAAKHMDHHLRQFSL